MTQRYNFTGEPPSRLWGVMMFNRNCFETGETPEAHLMRNLERGQWGFIDGDPGKIFFREKRDRDRFHQRFGGMTMTLDHEESEKRRVS